MNTTGCCARFDPEGWDGQDLHFRDKPFVRVMTPSEMYVHLDMGPVFTRVQQLLSDPGAYDPGDYIVLSRDLALSQA